MGRGVGRGVGSLVGGGEGGGMGGKKSSLGKNRSSLSRRSPRRRKDEAMVIFEDGATLNISMLKKTVVVKRILLCLGPLVIFEWRETVGCDCL